MAPKAAPKADKGPKKVPVKTLPLKRPTKFFWAAIVLMILVNIAYICSMFLAKGLVTKKYFRRRRGWQLYGRSLYYIAKGEKTWHSAENYCAGKNSHLASILSDEEQNFITSQLKHSAWIGLTDEHEEGIWKWTDNSRFVTQYWSDAKPGTLEHNEGAEKDCASIIPSTTGKNWNAADCFKLNGWVCKDRLIFDA